MGNMFTMAWFCDDGMFVFFALLFEVIWMEQMVAKVFQRNSVPVSNLRHDAKDSFWKSDSLFLCSLFVWWRTT